MTRNSHPKYINPLRKIWSENEDIDLWLDQSFEYLKTPRDRKGSVEVF